ncbi:MAG TPA: Wzz/FepE/Etk N-terminal domain-containing protein [Gaiellaceae bacterium]
MERPTPVRDLDAEQEVDLRSVWDRIAARWWLPVLGLVLGLVAGYLLALGGGKVYEAETLVAMGQPFSPNGGAPVQSFLTNQRAVAEIIRSESALRKAANAADLPVRALRGKVASAVVGASGPGARPTGAPLVTIRVIAAQPRKAERAADALAAEVITRTSAQYVDTKITAFNDQLESIQEQLNTLVPRITQLERSVNEPGLAALDKLVLLSALDNAQARRGQLLDLQSDVQQQLALAQNVEKAQVVEPAAAVKTTARSGRNSALVGALIGLILGCAAALLADPFLARRARTA